MIESGRRSTAIPSPAHTRISSARDRAHSVSSAFLYATCRKSEIVRAVSVNETQRATLGARISVPVSPLAIQSPTQYGQTRSSPTARRNPRPRAASSTSPAAPSASGRVNGARTTLVTRSFERRRAALCVATATRARSPGRTRSETGRPDRSNHRANAAAARRRCRSGPRSCPAGEHPRTARSAACSPSQGSLSSVVHPFRALRRLYPGPTRPTPFLHRHAASAASAQSTPTTAYAA